MSVHAVFSARVRGSPVIEDGDAHRASVLVAVSIGRHREFWRVAATSQATFDAIVALKLDDALAACGEIETDAVERDGEPKAWRLMCARQLIVLPVAAIANTEQRET